MESDNSVYDRWTQEKVIEMILMLCLKTVLILGCQTESQIKLESVGELVEKLVSVNQAPNPDFDFITQLPESFDQTAQEAVDAASKELLALGFKAIPELINHIDDKRYCKSVLAGRVVDVSVGEECFGILEKITNPRVTPNISVLPTEEVRIAKGRTFRQGLDKKWHQVDKSFLRTIIFDDNECKDIGSSKSLLTRWWKKFSAKSLAAVHLAAIDRRIQFEESIGFSSAEQKTAYLKPVLDVRIKLSEKLRESKGGSLPNSDAKAGS